jgi:hypothetical protein
MDPKSFFKPSKIKVIATIIIILILPIKYTVPSFCDAVGGCGDSVSYTLPLFTIIGSFSELITPAFGDLSLGFDLFVLNYLGLVTFSTFWFNLIISYPLACLINFIYSLKKKKI